MVLIMKISTHEKNLLYGIKPYNTRHLIREVPIGVTVRDKDGLSTTLSLWLVNESFIHVLRDPFH